MLSPAGPAPLQFQFMTFLFAGSSGFSYKGRDLTSVHIELTKKFGFCDDHFDLAKVMLATSMTKLGVPEDIQVICLWVWL